MAPLLLLCWLRPALASPSYGYDYGRTSHRGRAASSTGAGESELIVETCGYKPGGTSNPDDIVSGSASKHTWTFYVGGKAVELGPFRRMNQQNGEKLPVVISKSATFTPLYTPSEVNVTYEDDFTDGICINTITVDGRGLLDSSDLPMFIQNFDGHILPSDAQGTYAGGTGGPDGTAGTKVRKSYSFVLEHLPPPPALPPSLPPPPITPGGEMKPVLTVSVVISQSQDAFDAVAYKSNLGNFLGVSADDVELTITCPGGPCRRRQLGSSARELATTITVSARVIMPSLAAAQTAATSITNGEASGALANALAVPIDSVATPTFGYQAFGGPTPPPPSAPPNAPPSPSPPPPIWQQERVSSETTLMLSGMLLLACFLYAGTAVGILRTDAERRPLALKLGFKLFVTSGDFASDVLYVGTSVYFSLIVWALSAFFTVAPTFFFFISSGALKTPWLTYAIRVCQTIRGRKMWKDGKLRFGLAVEFKSWDDALAVMAFVIYLLILRPVITVFLYIAVFAIALSRALISLIVLTCAINLKLAMFPKTMASIMYFATHPPATFCGLHIRGFERAPTKDTKVDAELQSYRWNLTILSELAVESLPTIITTVYNTVQLSEAGIAQPTAMTYVSLTFSTLVVVTTLYPVIFWLLVGRCSKERKTFTETLMLPIFPLTKDQEKQKTEMRAKRLRAFNNTHEESRDRVRSAPGMVPKPVMQQSKAIPPPQHVVEEQMVTAAIAASLQQQQAPQVVPVQGTQQDQAAGQYGESEWTTHLDPASGKYYFVHTKTGEARWADA